MKKTEDELRKALGARKYSYNPEREGYIEGYMQAQDDMTLQWTDKPPTKPGWYFVREKFYPRLIRILWIFRQNKVLHVGIATTSKYCKTQTLRQYAKDFVFEWSGPIPEPEE